MTHPSHFMHLRGNESGEMWDERGRGAAPARTVVSRSACAGGRVERTLNDTEMVRRKTQPALQPPAPLGGWPCAGASYLLLFRSPAPPTMCQVRSTPTLRRGAHLSSDFTWNIGQALASAHGQQPDGAQGEEKRNRLQVGWGEYSTLQWRIVDGGYPFQTRICLAAKDGGRSRPPTSPKEDLRTVRTPDLLHRQDTAQTFSREFELD